MRFLLVLSLLCASAAAQTPATASPTFEVATLKPSDPDKCCARTFSSDGRHFATTNTNLKYLIQWAWNLQAKQVIGGPAWMDQDRFDLGGQIEGVTMPTGREWKLATQQLLIDRFHLQFHNEKKDMPAYILVLAKGGPKLTPGDPGKKQGAGFGGGVGQTMSGGGTNASLADITGELQRIVLDRPIVDHTGLTGTWDIKLSFTREDPGATGTTPLPDNAAPSLFDALQQQLGLKLEKGEAPVDVLVLDHVERPTPN